MDDLSSLNLSDTNKMGSRRKTKGRGYSYTALEPEDAVDDLPSISDDDESDPDVDSSARNGRKKWQSRLKVHSSWIWNAGWQLWAQRRVKRKCSACLASCLLLSGPGMGSLPPVVGTTR